MQTLHDRIDKDLRLNRRAKQVARALLGVSEVQVCMTNDELTKMIGASERTLQTAFRHLTDAGYGYREGGHSADLFGRNTPATWHWGKRPARGKNAPVDVAECSLCRWLLGNGPRPTWW